MAAGGSPLSIRNPEPRLEDEIAKLIREIAAYDEKVKAKPIQPSSQNTNPYEEEMELQGEWQRLYELVQNLLHDEPERHDELMALLEPYAVRFGEPSQGQYGGRRKARKSKSKSKSKKSKSKKSKSKKSKSKTKKSKGRK